MSTELGKYSAGTNAPQRNAEPRAITFTIPDIAFLLLVRELIKIDKVSAQNVNINELMIDINPLKENIISPTTITPIITNKSQTILEKIILASNILLL